jgi:hypothetical protein
MPSIHSKEKYHRMLRLIASALAEWRAQEDLSIPEMADESDIGHNQIMAALLAQDWKPSLEDLAKVESATGKEVVVFIRNEDS